MSFPRAQTPEHPARRGAQRAVLAVTFFLVLAAVSVSTGLVVHTARLHDIENGPFAIAFAVLSARATLSWCLWRSSYQQNREGRKPADGTVSQNSNTI